MSLDKKMILVVSGICIGCLLLVISFVSFKGQVVDQGGEGEIVKIFANKWGGFGELLGQRLISKEGKGGEEVKIMRVEPGLDETVAVKLEVVRIFFEGLLDFSDIQIRLNPVVVGETLINKREKSVSFYLKDRLMSGRWYEVEVYKGDQLIYVWQINTGDEKVQSVGVEQLENFQSENYPLVELLPMDSASFGLEYMGRKKLKVRAYSDRVGIEGQVYSWIKDHGVDPKSHELVWESY